MATVKSADRVIQILEAVGQRKEGLTHSELSRVLNIPKGSLSFLCSNLLEREYLVFYPETKRYTLGPQILALTGRFLDDFDITRLGQPIIRELSRKHDEDAEITIRKGKEILITCKESCSKPIRRVIAVGDRYPMYATAAGKVILSYFTERELDQYFLSVELKPITKKTITDVEILKSELKKTRAVGLSFNQDEFHEGVSAIASPIFDLNKKVVASMAVIIPTLRFHRKVFKAIEEDLRGAADRLSYQLGFRKKD
jgi:IclR family transcriptional regulator, KDG regulon repressor